MNDLSSLGKRLKTLRNLKKLSQRELAKQLNIAPSTLAMYEIDKREPDYNTLKKIADFFQVSTDYLLGRINTPAFDDIVAEKKLTYNPLLPIYAKDQIDDLPEEAKKTLEEFIQYIYNKYKK